MQEYLRKSKIGTVLDGLGARFLVFLLCMGWFFLLWDVRLPAITAGAALFFMLLILERKTRDGRLKRREEKLRRQLGGELALERLLLAPGRRAHFETVMLLSQKHPLILLQAGEEGVLCQQENEKIFIALCRFPVSDQITARDVLSLQRIALEKKADRAIFCAACAISDAAREQGKGEMPITFFPKDRLLSLLGAAYPATDAQLVALGKRKRAAMPLEKWAAVIFHPARARRYMAYGALLLGLYYFTHLPFYAFPSMLCFFLAAGCRCHRKQEERL